MQSLGNVKAVSSLYETQPVEFTDQPWFLNCAVALETSSTPPQLMQLLLEIEKAMGRQRIEKKGPRSIDIDVLLFGDEVVNTPEVTIPHPAMHQRRFVLVGLAQIARTATHPVLKKTIQQLLHELPKGQIVKKFESEFAANLTDSHGSKPTIEDP
jgi:2-amino-4-hydroxy-6-hydroxymethyldihydropteridine diphosphokinase